MPGSKLFKVTREMRMHDRSFEPEDFLAAIAELLFLTIATSYVITYFFNRPQLYDNPIRRMVGYNNPCVFWDAPPALWLAFLMFAPMVYLAVRYAVTDSLRADLLFKSNHPAQRWHTFLYINWAYAFSQILCMGIFVITPQDGTLRSMLMHSFCFLQLVPMICVCIAGNYLEAYRSGVRIETWRWVALALYVSSTVLETVFASTGIFLYKNDGVPIHNPILMQAIDYSWFLTLPLGAAGMPPAPNLRATFVVNHDHLEEGVAVLELGRRASSPRVTARKDAVEYEVVTPRK